MSFDRVRMRGIKILYENKQQSSLKIYNSNMYEIFRLLAAFRHEPTDIVMYSDRQ